MDEKDFSDVMSPSAWTDDKADDGGKLANQEVIGVVRDVQKQALQ